MSQESSADDKARIDAIKAQVLDAKRAGKDIPDSLVDYVIVRGVAADSFAEAVESYSACGYVEFKDASWGEKPKE